MTKRKSTKKKNKVRREESAMLTPKIYQEKAKFQK